MKLFQSTPLSYVGVDVGGSGVKVVELANVGGKPRLVTYGIVETALQSVGAIDPRDRPEEVAHLLKQVMEQARITTRKANTALPTFSVFSSIITMASMPHKELASAVRWEAKKIIPLPLEEMILDFKVLGEFEQAGVEAPSSPRTGAEQGVPTAQDAPAPSLETHDASGKKKMLRVLLTAAAKDLVTKYVQIFEKSTLTLLSLETEAFALVRCLVGVDPTTVVLVDMGAVNTDISIIDSSVPVLNRSIDVGGSALSRALAGELKLNLEEAEQYKRDVGLPLSPSDPLPQWYNDILEPIVNEVRYTLSLYQRQLDTLGFKRTLNVEKVILTGGSAFLPGLQNYLSRELHIKTYVGDPWARVVVPQELRPTLTELGPRLAIAVGLAMRNIQ